MAYADLGLNDAPVSHSSLPRSLTLARWQATRRTCTVHLISLDRNPYHHAAFPPTTNQVHTHTQHPGVSSHHTTPAHSVCQGPWSPNREGGIVVQTWHNEAL